MKKTIGIMVGLLILLGLNGCTKKAFVTEKIINFESGSTFTFDDMVSIDPSVDSSEIRGTLETKIPGTYEIMVIVVKNGETGEVRIKYTVVDTTLPVITQNTIPSVRIGTELVLSDYVSVTDNSGEDLSSQLSTIVANTTTAGDFEIPCELTDSSGNKASISFKFSVVSDAPPVITQNFIPNVPKGGTLKLSQFLSVTDDSGESFVSKLEALKVDSSVLGDHEVLFKIKDGAGNESSLTYKYTVVDANELVSGFTYKTSYLYDNGKTWKVQLTFNALTIVDKLPGVSDISEKKYIVMDMTIKNIGTDALSESILQMPEIMHPEVVARNIEFSSGEKIDLNYRDIISTDSSKTYDYIWDVGQTWRLYWYISVSDDLAKKDFVINVPINFTKYQLPN